MDPMVRASTGTGAQTFTLHSRACHRWVEDVDLDFGVAFC